jgi:hypothetical protein
LRADVQLAESLIDLKQQGGGSVVLTGGEIGGEMETIFRWEVTGLIGYTAASAMRSLEARATIFLS